MVANGISPEDARLIGIAHELDAPAKTGAPAWQTRDSRIDVHNNSAGIAVGLAAREKYQASSAPHDDPYQVGTPNPSSMAVQMVEQTVSSGGCGYNVCFSLMNR